MVISLGYIMNSFHEMISVPLGNKLVIGGKGRTED